jgi:hypothetical protein
MSGKPLLVFSRRSVLPVLATTAMAVAAPAAWAVGAIKHYILIEVLPGSDQLELDRWYLTFHGPQVRRAFKAWQRNYVSFRSYLPPEEAASRYKILFGRMTEIQFDTLADFQETRPNNVYGELSSFTPPPGGWRTNKLFKSTTATIPVNATELYVSGATPPKEIPYLRWVVFFRYPEGVTQDEGDAWWTATHAPELSRLPGLKRFAYYRSVRSDSDYPRVAEFWFDDYLTWRAAFLSPAPRFTAPRWAKTFPFFDMISMFVGENPDIDFVNDDRVIP